MHTARLGFITPPRAGRVGSPDVVPVRLIPRQGSSDALFQLHPTSKFPEADCKFPQTGAYRPPVPVFFRKVRDAGVPVQTNLDSRACLPCWRKRISTTVRRDSRPCALFLLRAREM